MKGRLLILLTCGAALGLLMVSGAGCVSCVIYREGPTTVRFDMTEYEIKSYITPECPWVEEALRDILGDPPYETSKHGFDDIRDWVFYDIDYMCDEERWGQDYWQTPEETLFYRTGDCEDFSTLLCSLLIAYGIDAEQVCVVIGADDEEGHAFLMEDWYRDGEWRRIEPQAPARVLPGPGKSHPVDAELDEYEIILAFNDLYCHDESFPWDED